MELPISCKTCQWNVDKPAHKCDDECHGPSWKNYLVQTPIVTNSEGGSQSASDHLWTDFEPLALLKVAQLSNRGNEKYGPGNWKKISTLSHINHAITHLVKYLAGDTSEDHLTHAARRVLTALGVEMLKEKGGTN